MKKLSLVLALVLVLTCALVACGGETEESSTPASSTASSKVESSVASSEASVESSEGSVEDEPAESSDETPVESSDAVVEDSSVEDSSVEDEPVEDDNTESTNIALGVSYDAKGYTAGGEWPANYTADLTDGVAFGEVSFDNQWFAFCTSAGDTGLNTKDGVGTVILDLGKSSKITKVRVNTLFGNNVDQSGVNGPKKITAYVGDSATGEFTLLGDLTSDLTSGVGYAELNCAGKGQFVKIEVTLEGIFAFLNEIEVYN